VVVHPQRIQHQRGQRARGLQLRHVPLELGPELRVLLLDLLQRRGRAPDVERKVRRDACAGAEERVVLGWLQAWWRGRVVRGAWGHQLGALACAP
jgi:hypothetical protein